jgi:hypothetical protein
VALNARDHQSLIDLELTDFYEANQELYAGMAQDAYDFTKAAVEAAGLPVRVDDVIQALEPTLAIEPQLRAYLAGKKKREKYWPGRFGDYVLDRLWDVLDASHEQEDEA